MSLLIQSSGFCGTSFGESSSSSNSICEFAVSTQPWTLPPVQPEVGLKHSSGRVVQVGGRTAQVHGWATYLVQHKGNHCHLNESLEVYTDHAYMQACAAAPPQHVGWHAISHPWNPPCGHLPSMPLSWPHTPRCTVKGILSEHGCGKVQTTIHPASGWRHWGTTAAPAGWVCRQREHTTRFANAVKEKPTDGIN